MLRRRPYERIVYVSPPEVPAARFPMPEGDAVLVVPADLSVGSYERFKAWMLLMIDLKKPTEPR